MSTGIWDFLWFLSFAIIFGFLGFALLLPYWTNQNDPEVLLEEAGKHNQMMTVGCCIIQLCIQILSIGGAFSHQFCAHFEFARGSSIIPHQQFDEKLRTKYVKSARLPYNYLRKGTWFCLDTDTITQMGLLARALFGIWWIWTYNPLNPMTFFPSSWNEVWHMVMGQFPNIHTYYLFHPYHISRGSYVFYTPPQKKRTLIRSC